MNRHANRSHHSISSFSQSSLLNFDKVRSTELVIVEQEAQQIDTRLDEAEQRLRILSQSTQSSVRELKKLFGTADKRKSHVRNKSASNCGGTHLHAIRHHLNMLEQDVHPQDSSVWHHNEHIDSTCEQSPSQHMQSQHTAKMGWPIRQEHFDEDTNIGLLREELKQLRKHNKQNLELQDGQLREMKLQHQEELRELRINLQHERLRVQSQLLNEIEMLNRRLSAGSSWQRRHQELQAVNQRLLTENAKLQESSRIERNLKIESMTRSKDIESQLQLIRQNNERMSSQINELSQQLCDFRGQMEMHAKETVWVCQTLLYSAEVLSRISNFELPATVVMIKEELNLKKNSIRRIINQLKAKYPADAEAPEGSTSRSGLFRLRQECNQPAANKFRKFISGDDSNKQNHNNNTTIERRSCCEQPVIQQQPPTTPFLDDITEIFSHEQNDLYMLLLVQANALQKKVQDYYD